MRVGKNLVNYMASLSYTGIVLAVVFFSISLSPSLLPRPFVLQGVLSGVLLALGYSIGVMIKWLWDYLRLPILQADLLSKVKLALSLLSAAVFLYAVYYSSQWQNELRALMGLQFNELGIAVYMVAIALVVALSILFSAQMMIKLFSKVKVKFKKRIPHRVANVFSFMLVGALVFFLTNNIIITKFVAALDNTYLLLDENIESDIAQPIRTEATGSYSSLIPWNSLGKTGQDFISQGPTKAAIEAFSQQESKQPLRVYTGLRTRETAIERAELALQELIRVNAFARKKLVIATPTGTGWLDPYAMDSFEYIHGGDTAIVSMQYSYLPSWLTLLVDPSSAKKSAYALYNKIHQYWSTLDKDSRPDLYLFGLSLGAFGAETSINLTTIINNPIQGGLLVGAPFTSTIAPVLTQYRQQGSPQYRPEIQDGSLVRFTAQKNTLDNDDRVWGPMRFVYVQYASDPIVFFSTDLFRKEPDWMKEPRAYDVSNAFQWFPLITFFQVLFDLPMADRVPRGNAHSYSADSYIDGWVEVSAPKNWQLNDSKELIKQLNKQ